MLESYNLKKHVQDLRQQLSHSLYQHDAACRVIARLTQERDRAVQFSLKEKILHFFKFLVYLFFLH